MHSAAWVDFKNLCGMKGIVRKEYIVYDPINRGSVCEHIRKCMEVGTRSCYCRVVLSFNLWSVTELTEQMISLHTHTHGQKEGILKSDQK